MAQFPEWQPIETAPNGGVFIYLSQPVNGRRPVGIAYRAKNGTIRSESGATDLTSVVTHWMPLPPAPTAAPASEEKV